jgi:hypothetical protein
VKEQLLARDAQVRQVRVRGMPMRAEGAAQVERPAGMAGQIFSAASCRPSRRYASARRTARMVGRRAADDHERIHRFGQRNLQREAIDLCAHGVEQAANGAARSSLAPSLAAPLLCPRTGRGD